MFYKKIIVITGGSSGLGKALSIRFLKSGAKVILIARNKDKLLNAKKELSAFCKSDQEIETFSCDVSDYSDVEQTMEAIIGKVGIRKTLSKGIKRSLDAVQFLQ